MAMADAEDGRLWATPRPLAHGLECPAGAGARLGARSRPGSSGTSADTRLISINFSNNHTVRILPQAAFTALVEPCASVVSGCLARPLWSKRQGLLVAPTASAVPMSKVAAGYFRI